MRKAARFLAILMAIPSATWAIDEEAQRLFEQMGEDAFLLVGITYLCSDAIGAGHYHAARVSAENTFKAMGMSDEDAVIAVDDFATRAQRENPVKAPAENASKCMDAVLQAQADFRVKSARFVKRIKQLKRRDGQ